MDASGEPSTDGVKIPDITHHNPELDLPGWGREAYGLSTAYDHSAHDRRAIGRQISMLNSITGRHATGVEGDSEGFALFVHRRVPLGGVLIRDNGDDPWSTHHRGWRGEHRRWRGEYRRWGDEQQCGVRGCLIHLNWQVKGHLLYAGVGSGSVRQVEGLGTADGVDCISAGIYTQAEVADGPNVRAM